MKESDGYIRNRKTERKRVMASYETERQRERESDGCTGNRKTER